MRQFFPVMIVAAFLTGIAVAPHRAKAGSGVLDCVCADGLLCTCGTCENPSYPCDIGKYAGADPTTGVIYGDCADCGKDRSFMGDAGGSVCVAAYYGVPPAACFTYGPWNPMGPIGGQEMYSCVKITGITSAICRGGL